MVKKSDIDWRAQLKPSELVDLAALEAREQTLRIERRRIYQRGRKRAEKIMKEKARV